VRKLKHVGTYWDIFGLVFLVTISHRCMHCGQYIVNIILVNFGVEAVEANLNAGLDFLMVSASTFDSEPYFLYT